MCPPQYWVTNGAPLPPPPPISKLLRGPWCMHLIVRNTLSQLVRQFDKAFGWREMVNTHDIARLRKFNTSFRIAMNDILCNTDSALGMVRRVYPLWLAAWLENTGSLEWLVWRSLYWHLGPGSRALKRFGGNACTFRYLLFDKACNTMYFTKLWCFAVELTLRFLWYVASATIRSPYMLFKMCKHEAFSFFSAADRILWQASNGHALVRFLPILQVLFLYIKQRNVQL